MIVLFQTQNLYPHLFRTLRLLIFRNLDHLPFIKSSPVFGSLEYYFQVQNELKDDYIAQKLQFFFYLKQKYANFSPSVSYTNNT